MTSLYVYIFQYCVLLSGKLLKSIEYIQLYISILVSWLHSLSLGSVQLRVSLFPNLWYLWYFPSFQAFVQVVVGYGPLIILPSPAYSFLMAFSPFGWIPQSSTLLVLGTLVSAFHFFTSEVQLNTIKWTWFRISNLFFLSI